MNEYVNFCIFVGLAIIFILILCFHISNYKFLNNLGKNTVYISIILLFGVTLFLGFISPELVVSDNTKGIQPNLYFVVLIIGVILTFIAFYVQYIFNQRQKEDLERERIENNLFNFFNQLIGICSRIEIKNIGDNKKAFHFIYYQYQSLYYILDNYIKHSHHKSYPIIKEELPNICLSFFFSGVTAHSNSQIKERVNELFKDQIQNNKIFKEELYTIFDAIENIILNLQRIRNSDLTKLRKDDNLLLYVNYAYLKIEHNLHIDWFWGHRTTLLPYIKYIVMIISYIKNLPLDDRGKNYYYRYVYSLMSEHEIGLLYIISQSPELKHLIGYKYLLLQDNIINIDNNDIIEKEIEEIRSVIKVWISGTNEMFNFKKWIVKETQLKCETNNLIQNYAENSPLKKKPFIHKLISVLLPN